MACPKISLLGPFSVSPTLLDLVFNIWYHITNMKANPVYPEKRYFEDGSFQEIKIWRVPKSKGKPHGLKNSFAYIVNNERVVGDDNYEHKRDHKHYRDKVTPYEFQGLEKLWQDFNNAIEQ